MSLSGLTPIPASCHPITDAGEVHHHVSDLFVGPRDGYFLGADTDDAPGNGVGKADADGLYRHFVAGFEPGGVVVARFRSLGRCRLGDGERFF